MKTISTIAIALITATFVHTATAQQLPRPLCGTFGAQATKVQETRIRTGATLERFEEVMSGTDVAKQNPAALAFLLRAAYFAYQYPVETTPAEVGADGTRYCLLGAL